MGALVANPFSISFCGERSLADLGNSLSFYPSGMKILWILRNWKSLPNLFYHTKLPFANGKIKKMGKLLLFWKKMKENPSVSFQNINPEYFV